jgi:hypothetical protein
MRAGRRNRLVTFYPVTTTEDGLGVEGVSQGTGRQVWVSVQYGSGAERREAGQAGSVQSATFRGPTSAWLRGATERWEIEHDGARWGITSIAPIEDAGDIEFTAIRKGA